MVTLQQTTQGRVIRNINPEEKALAADCIHFGSVFWLYSQNMCAAFASCLTQSM